MSPHCTAQVPPPGHNERRDPAFHRRRHRSVENVHAPSAEGAPRRGLGHDLAETAQGDLREEEHPRSRVSLDHCGASAPLLFTFYLSDIPLGVDQEISFSIPNHVQFEVPVPPGLEHQLPQVLGCLDLRHLLDKLDVLRDL